MDGIPVIDISACSLDKPDSSEEDLRDLGDQVCHVLSTVGFMYIKNHGLPDSVLKAVQDAGEKFFNLPTARKSKYLRSKDNNNGWVCMEMESLNPERPGDLKELYNITPSTTKVWPDEDVEEFQDTVMEFFKACDTLSHRLLKLIAIGLKLQSSFFTDCHNTFTKPTTTTLRLLHYPALSDNIEIKARQLRCGEHSDYGTITLLFQDSIGGLEVRGSDGKYVAATPIEGTVLVNIGDLMQRWTSDKLTSTKHRVLVPEEEALKRCNRHSIAFFVSPDDDCLVTCTDDSDKYPPITANDYLQMRFAATY